MGSVVLTKKGAFKEPC